MGLVTLFALATLAYKGLISELFGAEGHLRPTYAAIGEALLMVILAFGAQTQ